ncbi:MAG: tetratricopeptide repeat protein [Oscillospiraceae bacterium]
MNLETARQKTRRKRRGCIARLRNGATGWEPVIWATSMRPALVSSRVGRRRSGGTVRAAEQDHPRAQFHLGWCYQQGKGVEKEQTAAVAWYQGAAEREDPSSLCALGRCYETGSGVGERMNAMLLRFTVKRRK